MTNGDILDLVEGTFYCKIENTAICKTCMFKVDGPLPIALMLYYDLNTLKSFDNSFKFYSIMIL